MLESKKTKSDFNHDDQGRAILGSVQEMAAWVKLGFEEQNKRRNQDEPFYQNFIDFRKCVLYASKTSSSPIFNFYELAGVVPGIVKIEGDANYLFEVKLDIHFDGSVLYGNFFHYVKFDGMVKMDNAEVISSFSCFRCQFDGYVYMQEVHLNGGFTFEQCEFNKGLLMSESVVGNINAKFNNCIVKERLSLRDARFINQRIKGYTQLIELTNSTVENLSISKIDTDGIPIYIEKTTIHGMKMHDMKMEGAIGFYSCGLYGFITSVLDEGKTNNRIKELILHCCNVKAQCHIENSNIEKVSLTFDKIEECGRFRLSQSEVVSMTIGSSSVFGQMDILDNKISSVDLDGTCVHGYLSFLGNDVQKYEDRQTLRLLKNEAKKVNDDVSAIHLYAQEMHMLLDDKSVSRRDKISLWLNKTFSNFGENWLKALGVTLVLSVILTMTMLGFGSGKYTFAPSGVFIGVGAFVTILLDSINVFSIPLFSETIEKYGLNVFGQILYFVIKLIVTYGSWQLVVAFRKYGRS